MNKKLVPIIVVLVLLAVGGYYMKMKKSPSMAPENQTPAQTNSEASEFAKAMQSGKPTTCTLTKDNSSMEYHLKGKLMAINTTTSVEGKTMVSHMINDSSYFYTWQDGQKQGTKMAIPTEEESKEMADKAKEYAAATPKFEGQADYEGFKNQGYTINCAPSSTSDSIFTPPSDINFVDPTAMMKQITTPDGSMQLDVEKMKQLQQQYGGDQ